MIIWLAEASGIEFRILQRALTASRNHPQAKQAAAVRKVLPWESIESRLNASQAEEAQRHFIAYHNADERGTYRTRRDEGAFLTRKNFRDRTLIGQHVWVFEGSGSPKSYRLARHGTVIAMTRDDVGEARIKFRIEGPEAPIVVTKLPWFRSLLDKQRSFANGFSSLRDAATIQSLEQIVRVRQKDAHFDLPIGPTTAQALVDARLGQGAFRGSLEAKWNGACAVTGCAISGILRASHIKPWAASTDSERLDPENGLLLVAHIDGLFDKGLLSFEKDGRMLLSKQISPRDRQYLRLPKSLRERPSKQQCRFLEYHREKIFDA